MGKYEKDKIVLGTVTGIEKYGIFVGLDEFYSGLIHISEISNKFVKNIESYVSIGETIRCKVIDVDQENYHVKLSIKGINYKYKRRKKSEIQELYGGFKPLEEKLDGWIKKEMLKIN